MNHITDSMRGWKYFKYRMRATSLRGHIKIFIVTLFLLLGGSAFMSMTYEYMTPLNFTSIVDVTIVMVYWFLFGVLLLMSSIQLLASVFGMYIHISSKR